MMFARHHNTTTLFSRLRKRTVRTSTSQRSHLLSCEHSWAEQTTGSRTMRLRERIHTDQEKTAQRQTTKTFQHQQIKMTSTAPSMFRNNVTARLTGFTRFHTCTAPNPQRQVDEGTQKTHNCGSSNQHRCRHGIQSKRRRIDNGETHRSGSSNHYHC